MSCRTYSAAPSSVAHPKVQVRPSEHEQRPFAGLVALSVTAAAPSAATQAAPLSVHQEPEVVRLIVPGDRIALDYKLESGIKSPAGSLYVRNDLRRRFIRVTLKLKGNPMGYDATLLRLSSSGEVLWSEALPGELKGVAQLPLRVGPDGTLYCSVPAIVGGLPRRSVDAGWMPVAKPDGRALSVSAQRRAIVWGYQPLAGGLTQVSGLACCPATTPSRLSWRRATACSSGRSPKS